WARRPNPLHPTYPTVAGLDGRGGCGVRRVRRDRRWHPFYCGNLVYNAAPALLFQWGVGIQHLELGKVVKGRDDRDETKHKVSLFAKKATRQVVKDYVLYPALSRKGWKSTITANLVANGIRNVWTNAVIFCGHFPDGAEKFTKSD